MDTHADFVWQKRLERVKAALEKNNMAAYIVQSANEVVPLVKQLVPAGSSVGCGGSATLTECGVTQLLKSGDYNYFDREDPTKNELDMIYAAFTADAYIASVNAITDCGKLYQMDGRSNRVAAIAFGPNNVVLIAGRNKIVDDLHAARQRNRLMSAPANAHRLNRKTPCTATGICADCDSSERICNTEVVYHRSNTKDRIKVILVNEELGF